MVKSLTWGATGVLASVLAILGHGATGEALDAWRSVLIVAGAGVVFAAAAELGLGRWSLVVLAALEQVVAHVLLSPVHGAGLMVHGSNLAVHGSHLATPGHTSALALGNPVVALLEHEGAWMVPLHIAAFLAVALLVGCAKPLLHLLTRLVSRSTAVPCARFVRQRVTWAVAPRLPLPSFLVDVVVRRGPPAFV